MSPPPPSTPLPTTPPTVATAPSHRNAIASAYPASSPGTTMLPPAMFSPLLLPCCRAASVRPCRRSMTPPSASASLVIKQEGLPPECHLVIPERGKLFRSWLCLHAARPEPFCRSWLRPSLSPCPPSRSPRLLLHPLLWRTSSPRRRLSPKSAGEMR